MKKLFTLALGVFFLTAPLAVSAHEDHRGKQAHRAELAAAAHHFGEDHFDGFDDSLAPDENEVPPENGNEVNKVLKFDSMVPISGSLVGTDIIRGVPGAGAPWVIGSGSGSLDATGRLKLEVTGLVLADSGANPAPTFRGVVSCIGADGAEAAPIASSDVPTDVEGNVVIDETLSFPGACFAPIVFVAGPEGQWFAVTGMMFDAATPDPATPVPAEPIPGAEIPATPQTAAPVGMAPLAPATVGAAPVSSPTMVPPL